MSNRPHIKTFQSEQYKVADKRIKGEARFAKFLYDTPPTKELRLIDTTCPQLDFGWCRLGTLNSNYNNPSLRLFGGIKRYSIL